MVIDFGPFGNDLLLTAADLQEYSVLQAKQSTGDAEEFIIHHKIKLQSALEQLLSRKKVNGVDELTALYQKGGLYLFLF